MRQGPARRRPTEARKAHASGHSVALRDTKTEKRQGKAGEWEAVALVGLGGRPPGRGLETAGLSETPVPP